MNEQPITTNQSEVKSNKNRKNLKTFLMALLCLLTIGAIGYSVYAWQQNQKLEADAANKNTQIENLSKELSSSKNDAQDLPAKVIDNTTATALVNTFYEKYHAASTDDNFNASLIDELLTKYGTVNLIKARNNTKTSDSLLCSQNTPTSKPVAISSKIDGEKAVVTVQEKFGDTIRTLAVNVIDQDGLRINSVDCSAAN